MSTIFGKLRDFKFYLNDVLTEAEIVPEVIRQGRIIDVKLRNGKIIRDIDIYKQKWKSLSLYTRLVSSFINNGRQ